MNGPIRAGTTDSYIQPVNGNTTVHQRRVEGSLLLRAALPFNPLAAVVSVRAMPAML